ncbi:MULTISPECIES: phytanoyl-CoA dioxygenase family protein [Cyanophyceae]|uniref:Phytanoyl-CoA dioxygenase family protein n=1 Tax=Leptolyngbya subtilissima DQ-A4 TaxID=2933933 RepID=A0ABV0K689_9CYAN|nr:phytanoyl-CoA dioxygenase family protein [Nodosilinea sp. FACHB-141]MBD2113826.1 phytanoyl-CoA dioxygenase family protein [Nodosilinea sp. FACHB-141]
MTPEQKSFFRERGYILLKKTLTKNQVGPIKEHILDELKRLKLWSSGKAMSASIKKMPAFQQIAKLSGMIKQNEIHTKVITQAASSTIASLTESKVVQAQSQLLISLPNQGGWTLNGLNWHTDISSSSPDLVPGIQAFVLIDDVKPHGGATLAMAGSHLLKNHSELSRIREVLREKGDIEEELRSSDLSIVEMAGQAGDLYLMDMRVLHTPSINSTTSIRMMATVRYLLE